ncbi:hypothetical protein SUVZ_15G0640 [Saccharomyces uvarum]|uniref:Uncharacterized protein n=1 Tax=Saccharomyces uvarum TaxID=230603 RepID=A0ABN8WP59_SACUV|nr:hypothetical protein SUVZ_15G0640 [Saccharomyces uvarum]
MEGTSMMTVTSHSSEDSSCISSHEQDTDAHNDSNTSGGENNKMSKRKWVKDFFKLSKSPNAKSNQSLSSMKSNQSLVSMKSSDNGDISANDYSFIRNSGLQSGGLSRSNSVKEPQRDPAGSQRSKNNAPSLAPQTTSSSSSSSSSSYDSVRRTDNSVRMQNNKHSRFNKEIPRSRESLNMNSGSIISQYNVDTQATAIMSDMQKQYESQQLPSLFINETLLIDPNGKVSEVIKLIFEEIGYKFDDFSDISVFQLMQEMYQLIKKESSNNKSKLTTFASKVKEKEMQVKSQTDKISKLETTNKAYKTKYKELSLENKKMKEALKDALKELDSESYDHDEEILKKYKYTKETLDRVNREQQLVIDQNEFLKKNVNELQNEVNATNFKFSLFKEKYAKLADSITELNTSTKKREALGENLTFECNELKEICLKYKKNIENLTNINKSLQSSFKNERKKVLDLRNERNLLKKQILLIECHGSYSLLLVSNILTCYRFLLPSETIIETETLIKELLNMNNSLSNHVSSSDQSPAEFSKRLESKCIEFEEKLLYFYQEVVTRKIIDIIYKCFISYYKKSRQNEPKPSQNSTTPYKQNQRQVPHTIK